MMETHRNNEPNTQSVNNTMMYYMPLVKRIAHHLLLRLPPGIQLDDLLQAGMMGLLEAFKHYDASKGASFETYAGIRIRGMMLDEVRKSEWAPRSVFRKARTMTEAFHQVETRCGREASHREVANAMGLSADEFDKAARDIDVVHRVNLDDMLAGEEKNNANLVSALPTPMEAIEAEEFQQQLILGLQTLPERERLVLSLYYDEELNLKEIGAVLGITESRVSQIHSKAMAELKQYLHKID